MSRTGQALVSGEEVSLLGSGWKPVSMIDVYNSVTFTLWLCGCNLKCPFCHNWRIAEAMPGYCYSLDIRKLLDELDSARLLIDYLHVTGGEPLVQHRMLAKLFSIVKESIGVDISLNTNFTLYRPLEGIVEKGLVDHLATDLKIPPHRMYGYPADVAEKLWAIYLGTLRMVSDYGITLELRIPVARTVEDEDIVKSAGQVLEMLRDHPNYYVIVQPLLGPPITTPRNTGWCSKHCDPLPEKLEHVAEILEKLGFGKIIIRKTLVFG